MADLSLLDRIIGFVVAVGGGWMFWIGLVLTVEPYLERAAPRISELLTTFLARKPERRQKVFRAVGVAALAVSVFQAWDEQHAARIVAERRIDAQSPSELQKKIDRLEAEKNAARWTPLTPTEISALRSRLTKIPAEPVVIGCETMNCKDLAESFGAAFKGAGWNDIQFIYRGGWGITGAYGLSIAPGDDRTTAIISAIHESTGLEIQPPTYDRSQVKSDPGIFFVIGAKPF